MARDRLQELLRVVEAEKAANGDVIVYLDGDHFNRGFDAEGEDRLSATLDKIETIWTLIHQLRDYIAELKQLHVEILNSAWTSEKVTAQLEDTNNAIQLTITAARTKLEELTQSVPKESADGYEPVLSRVLRTHCNALQRAVRDVIIEYNTALMSHQERCAELVRQQLRIARRSLTNEEFQQEIGAAQNPFTENILLETLVARQALDDLHTRQKELQDVEASLLELKNMFVNIAVLIEEQGEFIDNIEKQVRNTKDYVEEASTKIENAKMLRKKYRKRKWCLIGFAVVAVVILVVILVVIYAPGQSSSNTGSADNPGGAAPTLVTKPSSAS